MAVLPLNTFRTITFTAQSPSPPVDIYVAPIGVTSIVLLFQVSAVNATGPHLVSAWHVRRATATRIVRSFSIPPNDSASLLSGRLVLEEGDRIRVDPDAGQIAILLSVVETANT